jgi:hypothetical protein
MKFRTLSIIPLLLFGNTLSHGAVIMVSPGQSVQAAINSASTGDEIVLQAGSYNEDLNITGKGLTLRAFNLPWIAKSISVFNSSTPCKFENFQLLEDLNSTDTNLEVRNANIGGSIKVNQAGLKLTKSTIDNQVLVNNSVNTSGSDTEAFITQSTISQRMVCKAKKSWVCYNSIRYGIYRGTSHIIGNHFNGRSWPGIGLKIEGAQTNAFIRNNIIHSYKTGTNNDINDQCIGILITQNAQADIINNLIYDCFDAYDKGYENRVGLGIYVNSTIGTKIFGNTIWNCFVRNGGNSVASCLVYAPSQGVLLHNNCLWASSHSDSNEIGGGVVKVNCFDANPKFTDSSNGDFTLKPESPCIDKGPPDPQYNDRDGSRNDIGMFGGHNFIPDGRTTNKPIVLGLDIAPIAVPTGGTVTIESTGATVK